MITKWWENKPGESSAMRIMAMQAACLSIAIVCAGVIGFFLKLPDSVLVIGSGCGLFGVAMGAKSFQAQAEYKEGGQ